MAHFSNLLLEFDTCILLNVISLFVYYYVNQSNLEFNVRMQEFVELVRRGDKMEAVRYAGIGCS